MAELTQNTEKILTPSLEPDELQKFENIVRAATLLNGNDPRDAREKISENLREAVTNEKETASTNLLACLSVYADLFEQGWEFRNSHRLALTPPGLSMRDGESAVDVKARLRACLQSAQRRQLREPSVQAFLGRMSRVVKRPEGRHSIASVIDDGGELTTILNRFTNLPEDEKEAYLSKHFKPEVEVCEGDNKCKDTGLKLIDVWRFFRHTWASVYRPIPGRQMPILIRNAARKNRPVMGIAMLSSPVMRLGPRDKWIGWTVNEIIERLYNGKLDAQQFIETLYERLDESLSEIRWDDIANEEVVNSPNASAIDKLMRIATKAGYEREDELAEIYKAGGGEIGSARDPDVDTMSPEAWLEASEDSLFTAKRSSTLAKLLSAKLELDNLNLRLKPENLRHLLTSKDGKAALETVLGEFRKAGLASQVMDLSICGAVPPYGDLLTGKLVALLMASQEVNDALQLRYGKRVSIISSQMAGRPITRDATLKVLTTTSLYGVGTSQYNRLRLSAAEHHGISNNIDWQRLGEQTSGFGQMHLSSTTHQFLKKIGWEKKGMANRTSRFGEGTSARMHQARLGLDALGLKSELVLKHETPRIVLGCDVFSNARPNLIGLSSIKNERKSSVNAISRAWRKRWLVNRASNPDVLSRLQKHSAASVYETLMIGLADDAEASLFD